MSTIAQNLTALQNAKAAIASAITGKGGTLGAGDGFADFASAILAIPTGSADPGSDPGSGGITLPTLTTPASAGDIAIGKEAIAANGTVLTGTLNFRHGTALLEKELKGMTLQLIQHNLGTIPKVIFVTKTADAAQRASNVLWAMYYSGFGLQSTAGTIYAVTDASQVASIQLTTSNRLAITLNASSFQLAMTDSKYSWASGETVEWWVFG